MLLCKRTDVYGRVTRRRSEVSRYSRGKIECKRWSNSENYSPYFCYISIARNESRWEGTTRIMLKKKKKKKTRTRAGKKKSDEKNQRTRASSPPSAQPLFSVPPFIFVEQATNNLVRGQLAFQPFFRSTLAIPFPGDVRNSAWLRRLASQKDAYAYFLSPPSNESSTISRRSNHVYCILWKRSARWRLDVLAPFTYGAARNP